MKEKSLPTLSVLTLMILASSLYAQIKQDQPELCGRANETVVLPRDMTAVKTSDGIKLVAILRGAKVEIPLGYPDEVLQVCPVAQQKYVVFSLLNGGGYDIAIISETTGTLIDRIPTLDSGVSPDRRWLVYRAFNPVHSELSQSEEYLLYDFNKDSKRNQTRNRDTGQVEHEGRVVFPVVPDNVPFNNHGLPDHQIHYWRSSSFHWAPDSKSIVFADGTQKGLALIWVKIGENDELSARVHPVSSSAVCGTARQDAAMEFLTLSDANVIPAESGSTQVQAIFRSSRADCTPKPLILRSEDFSQAEIEKHDPPPPRKRPVPLPKK